MRAHAAVVFSFLAHAGEFASIDRFSQISDADRVGTLVVLDLDETVMKPEGYLGSEAWYQALFEKALIRQKDRSVEGAHRIATRIWGQTQAILRMKLLDPQAAAWVKDLQDRGVAVIALTARRPGISRVTIRQLEELGIHFTVEKFSKLTYSSFEEGIIFAGEDRSKGLVLKEFLKNSIRTFRQVIFVDNAIFNLAEVAKAFENDPVKPRIYHFTDSECLKAVTPSKGD